VSDCGKKIRLNRVLGGSKHRALVVAFDHALVLGPIPGTEDPLGKIRQFAQANVDALLLNLGLIRQFANSTMMGPTPSLIARLDWTTVWSAFGENGNGALHSSLLAHPEDALRHGADAVLTYLVVGTGDAEFEMKEITRNAEIARECEQVGIPQPSLGRMLLRRITVAMRPQCVRWWKNVPYQSWCSVEAAMRRTSALSILSVKLQLQERPVSSLAAMFSKPTT